MCRLLILMVCNIFDIVWCVFVVCCLFNVVGQLRNSVVCVFSVVLKLLSQLIDRCQFCQYRLMLMVCLCDMLINLFVVSWWLIIWFGYIFYFNFVLYVCRQLVMCGIQCCGGLRFVCVMCWMKCVCNLFFGLNIMYGVWCSVLCVIFVLK